MVKTLNKNNYFLIDLLKLFFAISVVAIHTYLFDDINSNLRYYSLRFIWRLAVPFFFITSGYFFVKKVHDASIENKKTICINSIKRLLLLFITWIIINLPVRVYTSYTATNSIGETIIDLIHRLFCYPWGAMWYVLALIIGYTLIYPFLKRKKVILPLIIGFLLYIFATLCNSYYFVIQNTFFQNIVDNYLKVFISARNAIFLGFFYIAISNFIFNIKISKKMNLILFFIGLCTLFIEISILKNKTSVDDGSLLFSHLLVIPSLINLAIMFSKSFNNYQTIGKKMRKLSIGIFLLHRPVQGYSEWIYKIVSGGQRNISSIAEFCFVILISAIISIVLQKVDNKYINKIIC